MENLKAQTKTIYTSLLIFLSGSLLLAIPTQAITDPGIIQRTTKQQLLATIPPTTTTTATTPTTETSEPFITSPSGKFAGYLLRRETSLGAGGFGNDFCYVQIQANGQSVWESECASVSTENGCTLVFSDSGLEMFDGSRSTWNTDADGENLETLELVDAGDMRIRDKDGNLIWKASDNPITNQNCGSIGSPDLVPAQPSFAKPIGGSPRVFGQPVQAQISPLGIQAQSPVGVPAQSPGIQAPIPLEDQEQQQQPLSGIQGQSPLAFQEQQQQPLNRPLGGLNQPFGSSNQPLIDNTPFDSGCVRGMLWQFVVGLGCFLVTWVVYGFLF